MLIPLLSRMSARAQPQLSACIQNWQMSIGGNPPILAEQAHFSGILVFLALNILQIFDALKSHLWGQGRSTVLASCVHVPSTAPQSRISSTCYQRTPAHEKLHNSPRS